MAGTRSQRKDPQMALVVKPVAYSPSDYEVMQGEWQVGVIDKRPSLVGPDDRWFWTLNRVPGGPENLVLAGVSETIGEAQAELKKSWE